MRQGDVSGGRKLLGSASFLPHI